MSRIFSNLNLNGATPPRVQPKLGEWGPEKVQSTKQKKRMRIWVGLALLGAMIAIFLLGWYVYHAMTGSWGFGIGEDEQFLHTLTHVLTRAESGVPVARLDGCRTARSPSTV